MDCVFFFLLYFCFIFCFHITVLFSLFPSFDFPFRSFNLGRTYLYIFHNSILLTRNRWDGILNIRENQWLQLESLVRIIHFVPMPGVSWSRSRLFARLKKSEDSISGRLDTPDEDSLARGIFQQQGEKSVYSFARHRCSFDRGIEKIIDNFDSLDIKETGIYISLSHDIRKSTSNQAGKFRSTGRKMRPVKNSVVEWNSSSFNVIYFPTFYVTSTVYDSRCPACFTYFHFIWWTFTSGTQENFVPNFYLSLDNRYWYTTIFPQS